MQRAYTFLTVKWLTDAYYLSCLKSIRISLILPIGVSISSLCRRDETHTFNLGSDLALVLYFMTLIKLLYCELRAAVVQIK